MGGRGRGYGSALRGGPQVSGGQRRASLSDAARQQIHAAYQVADAGKHADAAERFAEAAARLSERGEHAIAMHLQLQGAEHLKEAGQTDGVVSAAAEAVGYAVHAQNRQKALRKIGKLAHDLREAGKAEAADAIEADVKGRMDVKKLPTPEGATAPTVNRAMRRALPKACPACGSAVKADQVEFSDDGLADCGRCGATLTA